jgi:hypothetical protein
MRWSLILLSVVALIAAARAAHACACCDGRSDVKLLGWAPAADRLLVREETYRHCERALLLAAFEIDRPEAAACFDLLRAPNTEVACAAAGPSPTPRHDEPPSEDLVPGSSAEEKRYTRPISSLTPDRVRARYLVTNRRAHRKASLEVSILDGGLDGGWTPLLTWPFHEYERDGAGEEGASDLVPLELAVVPAPSTPGGWAVVLHGHDEDPGNGHLGWKLRWARTDPARAAAATTTAGVSWIRALPALASPPWSPERAAALNRRGLEALRRGNLAGAIGHFEDALRYRPSHVLARYNLACAEARSGWSERAVATLTELLESSSLPVKERAERRRRALADPDLAPLQRHPGFRKLVCDGPCPASWPAP